MQARTITSCFGLLFLVLCMALAGELLFSRLSEFASFSPHKIFPVTSIPHWTTYFRKASQDTPQDQTAGASKYSAQPDILLQLKNGKEVRGKLIARKEGWFSLEIDGSEVGFHQSEIAQFSIEPKEVPVSP